MTAPVVTAVSAFSNPGPRYYSASSVVTVGDAINFVVAFSEPVTVSGTPTLLLSNGATATYDGTSSPSDLAYFSYVPQSTDSGAAALTASQINLNGGTIVDSAGNNLALPVPASAIQTVPVLDVPETLALDFITQSPTDAVLPVGGTDTIGLIFDEPVTVTNAGALTLSVSNGGTASYTGGSGTNTLLFAYTVGAASNNTTDLLVDGINLDGAVIADAGGSTPLSGALPPQSGPQIGTSGFLQFIGSATTDVTDINVSSFLRSSTSETVSIPEIINTSSVTSSGTPTLEFWYVPSQTNGAGADISYTGGIPSGDEVGTYGYQTTLSPLYQYGTLAIPLNYSAISVTGLYDEVILLTESNNGTNQIDDWILIPGALDVIPLSGVVGELPRILRSKGEENDTDPGASNGDPSTSSSSGSGADQNSENSGGSVSFSRIEPPISFSGVSTLSITSSGGISLLVPAITPTSAWTAPTGAITVTLSARNSDGQQTIGTIADGAIVSSGGTVPAETVTLDPTGLGGISSGTYNVLLELSDANADNLDSAQISYLQQLTFPVTGAVSLATVSVPTTPTGLTANNITSGGATLAWQPAGVAGEGAVSGYVLFQNGASLETVSGTSATIDDLSAAANYDFAVAAVDLAGMSPVSANVAVATASTVTTTIPNVPAGLTAGTAQGGIGLSWQPATASNATVIGYAIYENGGLIDTTSSTSYVVSGLPPSSTSSFSVAAYDSAGSSAQSSAVVGTTPAVATPSGNTFPAIGAYLSTFSSTVLSQVEATLVQGGTPINDVTVSDGSAAASAITGSLDVVSESNAAAGSSTEIPPGYRAGFLLGGGPATLADVNGNALLVAVTPTATLSGGANDTLIGGDGATTEFTNGSAGTIIGGAGTNVMYLNAALSAVVSQGTDVVLGDGGAATVNADQSVFFWGGKTTGQVVFNAGSGPNTVVSGSGGATITGGAGNSLYWGNAPMTYTPGTATDTVVGSAGALSATGGPNGTLIFGGAAGNNTIGTGAGSATIIGGGNGDVLTATGKGSDVIAASAGAETINGAGSGGTDDFFGGLGSDCIVGGGGTNAIVAGPGNMTLIGGGTVDLFIFEAGATSGTLITDFNPARDFIHLSGFVASVTGASILAAAKTSAGGLVLTLPDNTTITFRGINALSASSFQ